MALKLRLLVLVAVMSSLASVGMVQAQSQHPAPTPVHYLAVGDSVTAGDKASDPATTGFVPLLAGDLVDAFAPGHSRSHQQAQGAGWFSSTNLGRLGGETTTKMIADGQLDEAMAILRARNQNQSPADDVRAITLTIGANDMRALFQDPACVPMPTLQCQLAVQQKLAEVSTNLHIIMSDLREAAGPETVIATMTYYNPFVGQCQGALPPQVLALVPAVLGGLNQAIAQAAGSYDIVVAPVHAAGLSAADMFGDCIHPNDSGYAKIAATFDAALAPALP